MFPESGEVRYNFRPMSVLAETPQAWSPRRFGLRRRAMDSRASRVPSAPPTVLVVDDVVAIRLLVRTVLEPEFTVVGEAGDGDDAITQARALQPDLVVLDLNMPRHDGLEALVAIREACVQTRVVVLSGLDPQLIGDKARALGAVGVVDKSEPLAALRGALLEALGA